MLIALFALAAPPQDALVRIPAEIAPQVRRFSDCFVDAYSRLPMDTRRDSVKASHAAFAACGAVKDAQTAEADAILAREARYADPARRRAALADAFDGYEAMEIAHAAPPRPLPNPQRGGPKPEVVAVLNIPTYLMPALDPYLHCRLAEAAVADLRGRTIGPRSAGCATERRRAASDAASLLQWQGMANDEALRNRVEAALAQVDAIGSGNGASRRRPPMPKMVAEISQALDPYIACRLKPPGRAGAASDCAEAKETARQEADIALTRKGYSDAGMRAGMIDRAIHDVDASFANEMK